MKRILLITKFLLMGVVGTMAQSVAINNTGNQPNASAALDINSTTKGLLIPRMTIVQRNAIASPATGLQVYQTDAPQGFYYFNGNAWAQVGAGGGNAGNVPGTTGWSLSGNGAINPAANFIGTTDSKPFIGKANGEQVFRFSPATSSTLLGYQAGKANATGGDKNHFIGYQAGFHNTSFNNQFEGYSAGFNNTSGYSNHFIGFQAGYSNTTGTNNLFMGPFAGYSNTTQSNSQFIGFGAGYSNTTGSDNNFSGHDAGQVNTTGSYNHFDGNYAGFSNTTGSNNFFQGYQAGYSTTTGNDNFFQGYTSGYHNTGNDNYFSGNYTGTANTSGYNNVFSGNFAGTSNTTGNSNVFNGYGAGYSNVSGNYNVNIGYFSGKLNTSGQGNVFIGYKSGFNAKGSNKLYISNSQTTNPLIYGEFDKYFLKINGHQEINAPVAGFPNLVLTGYPNDVSSIKFQTSGDYNNNWLIAADPSNQDGELDFIYNGHPIFRVEPNGDAILSGNLTELSDKKLKKNIVPLKNCLEGIIKINGYTYNWIDKSKSATPQIGFLAQELEAVFPGVVDTDKNGYKSVSYTHMVPVLLEGVKDQQSMISDLTIRVNDLTTENTRLKKDIELIKAKLGL